MLCILGWTLGILYTCLFESRGSDFSYKKHLLISYFSFLSPTVKDVSLLCVGHVSPTRFVRLYYYC